MYALSRHYSSHRVVTPRAVDSDTVNGRPNFARLIEFLWFTFYALNIIKIVLSYYSVLLPIGYIKVGPIQNRRRSQSQLLRTKSAVPDVRHIVIDAGSFQYYVYSLNRTPLGAMLLRVGSPYCEGVPNCL